MHNPYLIFKRILDFTVSLILIIILSPLFVAISIAIKLDSPGPAFFKQFRTGKNGKDFELLKFRSMAKDNDVYNFEEKDKVTKMGEFIRKTSLDELPQLINILRGEMSFIGPRPWLSKYYNFYTDHQKKRHLVRPGLTGLAQVSGRKDLNILQRIDYDVKYVNNLSLSQDVDIGIKTIKVIFTKDNNTYQNYSIEDERNDLVENYKNSQKNEILKEHE